MKYSIIIKISVLLLIQISTTMCEGYHSPKFTKKGELLMKKFREYNHCYDINYGTSYRRKINDSIMKPSFNILLYDCKGFINYIKINKGDSVLFENIATLFNNECENKEEFEGINITIYDRGENPLSKRFDFKVDKNGKLKFFKYSYTQNFLNR